MHDFINLRHKYHYGQRKIQKRNKSPPYCGNDFGRSVHVAVTTQIVLLFRFSSLCSLHLTSQYKGSKCRSGSSIDRRISGYVNLKLTCKIALCPILIFAFNNFKFVPNCKTSGNLKNQLFLLLNMALISLSLPLSLLQLTTGTYVVCLQ